MFYECPKCKRRWEYPLAECPYCLVPLEKAEGKAAKVVGAVKVSIPTLLHPNVPYYVLVLEDERGNMWGYKSEKEYKVGDVFAIEAAKDPDAVGIWRVKYDLNEALVKVLELIGGIDIDSGSKVVVLPTMAAASHAYFRDNTSPEFLSAILRLLLDRGAKAENIVVAGQSFDDIPVVAMAQKAGLIAAGARFNVNALDLATAEFVKNGYFEIAKHVAEADLVLNLAIGKMGKAVASENLFRALKKENYLGQKYLSSDAEILAQLEPLLKNMMVLAEAESVQRSNKLTTFMGLVLSGRSSRNVDRVFNEVAKSFKLPETIKDTVLPEVAGRTIKEVQYQAEIY
ncbi:MAG: DUF362 domain-containing protein [Candidatus Pacebacteria bacterium]|jgi:hypothetical protein|nr:DUF362 domain-containing protein [Candidatus Paceibacterota bacterium]